MTDITREELRAWAETLDAILAWAAPLQSEILAHLREQEPVRDERQQPLPIANYRRAA